MSDLTALWVDNIRDEHARIKMREVKEHLEKTCFGWVGGIDSNAVFYYRIQSPVILIEFDHELPGPLGQVRPSSVPTRSHIHAIMRTPNGNDYGKTLLRQHLLTHNYRFPIILSSKSEFLSTNMPIGMHSLGRLGC